MAGVLPDGYRRLGRFAVRIRAGAAIYEQGAIPANCLVVLAGLVDFEIVDADGQTTVVASAEPGDLLGHVAAFTGRPTSAAARARQDSVVLSIPIDRLLEAFREAPELAMQLVTTFADPERAARSRSRPAAVAGPVEAQSEEAPKDDSVIALPGPFDDTFFFSDIATCPISETRFEFLRVRTRSVRPSERDSDFFVKYTSLDPTHYSLVVCPRCGYASYHDDFAGVDVQEVTRLKGDISVRVDLMGQNLSGVRTLEDAARAIELAMRCYAMRDANDRRRAVLLHRRAWIERQRGDADAEAAWIREARDAYQQAYEGGKDISDESAMRVAYLIGDLTLRLGDVATGARWLETATRSPEAKSQSGLTRMARDRLYDARQMLQEAQKKAS